MGSEVVPQMFCSSLDTSCSRVVYAERFQHVHSACQHQSVRSFRYTAHSLDKKGESELRRNGVERELTRENGALIMYARHNNSLCLSNLLVSDEFFIRLRSLSLGEREEVCYELILLELASTIN